MKHLSVILKYGIDIILLYLFFAFISVLPHVNIFEFNLVSFANLFFSNLQAYTYNLLHGDFGIYSKYFGKPGYDRQIWQDMIPYALHSFKLLFISLTIATFLSVFLGTLLSLYRKKDNLINGILTILNSIPDFILILLLQWGAVFINSKLGTGTVRLSSYGENDAILLPVITLIIIPLLYFTREIVDHISIIVTEEYIRTALAKGLSKWTVVSEHIFTNLIPYLKADLIKVISISIGNLFIVEHLYSLKGITSFMFSYPKEFGLWMTGFIFLTAIFLFMYLFILLLFVILRRIVVGE